MARESPNRRFFGRLRIMNKVFILGIFLLIVIGVGVFYGSIQTPQDESNEKKRAAGTTEESRAVVLPIAEYQQRRTFNGFGEFSQGALAGYHVGEDIEYTDVLLKEVPIRAIAQGVVRRIGSVSGYGGVVVILHTIEDRQVHAIYGHIDLASSGLSQGDPVEKGEFLANLGDHESEETDGERKHLHFALYEGEELRLQGYESSSLAVESWINPHNFFEEYGYDMQSSARTFDPTTELGGSTYPLEFLVPQGWEVEYVRTMDALSLYTLGGKGMALERSQVFIQHFDATDFLTLSTVTIHQTEDTLVGAGYTARQYDIEKKEDVPSFFGQPSWRNLRHIATDFRKGTGYTRYFTVAARPGLDVNIYEEFLGSIRIVEP